KRDGRFLVNAGALRHDVGRDIGWPEKGHASIKRQAFELEVRERQGCAENWVVRCRRLNDAVAMNGKDTGSRVVVQALFVWNFRFRREGSTIRTPDLYLFRRSRGKRDVLLRLAVLAGVRSVKRPRSLILILGIKRDRAIYGLVENLVRILSIWIIPVRALELK